MTTTPTTATNATGGQVKSSKFALQTEDFIKMMITQLQNQDPLEPAKNEQLLAQMSQIGQLQSSQQLQESLKSMVLQNNLGAASSLIGKTVQGQLDNGEAITGVVNSIKVENDNVTLELDSGHTLKLDRITSISPTRVATVNA
jgi:flagellar basal-body rod modification protein FlgD